MANARCEKWEEDESLEDALRNPNVTVEQLKSAVQKELSGSGKLLGIRTMQNTVRQKYQLDVPRIAVHAMMYDLDEQGLQARIPAAKHKRRKGDFTTKEPNWVFSLDVSCEVNGVPEKHLPPCNICVYWHSKPEDNIRIDKGTETGEFVTIHAFLWERHGDMDPIETVMYGSSTSNQIERWWRELHERLEFYYKEQLRSLKEEGYYDPHSEEDRSLLAFEFIPVLQKVRILYQNSHILVSKNDMELLSSENETDEDDGNSFDEKEVISYYFNAGYTNEDILLLLEKHHGHKISIRTLKHRLSDYGLHRHLDKLDDRNMSTFENAEKRIREIINGPGSCSGYRSNAMEAKKMYCMMSQKGNKIT
eukprot:gene21092-23153_t